MIMKSRNFENGLALLGVLVILIGVSAAAASALDGGIGGGLQRYSKSKSFITPTGFDEPNLSPLLSFGSHPEIHQAISVE